MSVRSRQAPRSIGVAAHALTAARGHPGRLKRVFERNAVPMVMADDGRRYVEVNRPARLLLRMSMDEFSGLRVDDLTPPGETPTLEAIWTQLHNAGCSTGTYEMAVPDGGRFAVVYYAVANVLPGMHVAAFAPEDWSDVELGSLGGSEPAAPLTPRELEIIQLAAQGRTGPRIADDLVVSRCTVKSHFENVYSKLGVPDRAAAVAKAMRLGLID